MCQSVHQTDSSVILTTFSVTDTNRFTQAITWFCKFCKRNFHQWLLLDKMLPKRNVLPSQVPSWFLSPRWLIQSSEDVYHCKLKQNSLLSTERKRKMRMKTLKLLLSHLKNCLTFGKWWEYSLSTGGISEDLRSGSRPKYSSNESFLHIIRTLLYSNNHHHFWPYLL